MGRAPTDPAGVLLVDKPAGPTSHDIVAAARVALDERRIGHAGTLDPFATGLLVLCVGAATRLAEYFHLLPKRYEAELMLGVETATHDTEGEAVRWSEAWREVTEARLRDALAAHTGRLEQRPPAFSAKRVGGRRAHEAARRGERLELVAVAVQVLDLELLDFEPPVARIGARVSAGTYLRALGRDLGRHLGCFAHLTRLRRTAVGPFAVADALPAERLEAGSAPPDLSRDPGAWWLSPAAALGWLPRRRLADGEASRVRSGSPIEEGRVERGEPVGEGGPPAAEEDLPVALLHGGRLLAVAVREGRDLQPRKVFPGV